MGTTRRKFVTASALGTAGLVLAPHRAWGRGPAGRREPAPSGTPSSDAEGAALLAQSPLLEHEPLARRALEAAVKAGASFADARLMRVENERLSVRDDHVGGVARSASYGIGVRVIADGAWGFAATGTLDGRTVEAAAARAVETARANAKINGSLSAEEVTWAKQAPVQGSWVSPHQVDPFAVSLDEKVDLLLRASKRALAVPGVAYTAAGVRAVREEKIILNSEGSRTHQLYFRIMPSLTATAIDRRGGRFASRDHEIQPMLAGWEHARDGGLVEDAEAVGRDALRKLYAAPVQPGRKQVILAPSNLWLTIHESIGHPTELDRSRWLEANYAGTSFIKPDAAGKLRIGSELVNVMADRTQPGGLATTAWDDDGVPGKRWKMVDEGIFVGWQTTRDQAAWIGAEESLGCSYGDSYDSVSFQRMPNISLQPGAEGYTTEDLINATDDGVLISGRGSWSIDQQRYNFQFSGQFFWEIKNGRLTRPLRDVAYQANTQDFWGSCDMLGGEGTYRLGGTFSDGKGQPGQSNAVSHGCPPARFTVNVLNTGGGK